MRDEEFAKFLPVRFTMVEIELADGTRLTERVTAVRGTPRNPMTRAVGFGHRVLETGHMCRPGRRARE